MLKKKIVFVQSYELFPDFRVLNEIELLIHEKVEIHVILWQRSIDGINISDYKNVIIHRIKVQAKHGMSAKESITLLPRFMLKVIGYLRIIKPSLIIAHNFDSMFPSAIYSIINSSKIIYVSREPTHMVFRQKLDNRLVERVGYFLDLMVAKVSSLTITVTPQLMKMYGNMGIKSLFVPNSPTKSFYESVTKKKNSNEVIIGFIGTIRYDVGIKSIWNAIMYLNNNQSRRFKLFLCGMPNGGFEIEIEKMKNESPDSIIIKNPVNNDKVPDLYNGIDMICIFPTAKGQFKQYGLSVKLFEALAMRTPVIISSVAENYDFIKEIDCCILSKKEPKEISEKIQYILSNQIKIEKMVNNGYHFIANNFNWENHSNHYKKFVYKSLNIKK
tara:strand:- start:24520 stop:25677 length:1158 start_codon:yes stop_codon:yes gene_type:complete